MKKNRVQQYPVVNRRAPVLGGRGTSREVCVHILERSQGAPSILGLVLDPLIT